MRPSTKEFIADNSIIGYHVEKCCINVLLSLTVVIESKEWLQTQILKTCVGRARGVDFLLPEMQNQIWIYGMDS